MQHNVLYFSLSYISKNWHWCLLTSHTLEFLDFDLTVWATTSSRPSPKSSVIFWHSLQEDGRRCTEALRSNGGENSKPGFDTLALILLRRCDTLSDGCDVLGFGLWLVEFESCMISSRRDSTPTRLSSINLFSDSKTTCSAVGYTALLVWFGFSAKEADGQHVLPLYCQWICNIMATVLSERRTLLSPTSKLEINAT